MAHAFTANHFRIAHSGVHAKRSGDASTCKTGGFYLTPSLGQSLESSAPLNITWNTACLNATTAVDILLYASSSSNSVIQTFTNVDYAKGTYNATLDPSWWNNTSPVSLQLALNGVGDPQWMATATYPAGPVFTVTVPSGSSSSSSGSANANPSSASSSDGITAVNNAPAPHHGPSKGAIAAAVICTLLAVAGLAYAAYAFYARRQRARKSEAFSEKVDRRMSVASQSWNAMGAAGFSAWRSSFWGKQGGEGGDVQQSAYGNGNGNTMQDANAGVPQMQQQPTPRPRPRTNTNTGTARVSRVSFASDGGSTGAGAGARRSAIFINAGQNVEDVIPPMPPLHHLYSSEGSEHSGDGDVTPSQAFGPEEVNVDDITARLSAHDGEEEDLSPALNMMLQQQQPQYSPNAITPTQRSMFPVPPTPSYNPATNSRKRSSPPSSFHDPATLPTRSASPPPIQSTSPTTMSPNATGNGSQEAVRGMMSPDDMLRAYAERRVASPPATAQAFPPMPLHAVVPAQSQARTLYNPAALPGAQQYNQEYEQQYEQQYQQEYGQQYGQEQEQYGPEQYGQEQYGQEEYGHQQPEYEPYPEEGHDDDFSSEQFRAQYRNE